MSQLLTTYYVDGKAKPSTDPLDFDEPVGIYLSGIADELIEQLRSELSAREAEITDLRALLTDTSDRATRAQLATEQNAFAADELMQKLAAYDACLAQVREEMPGGLAAMMERYAADNTVGTPYPMDRLLEAIGYIALFQRHEAANRNRIAELEEQLETVSKGCDYNAERYIEANRRITELTAQIRQLQSPPKERRDIAERQSARKDWLAGEDGAGIGPAFTIGSITEDFAALLEDVARYRNAHSILMSDNARLTAANAEYTKRHVEHLGQIQKLQANTKVANGLLVKLQSNLWDLGLADTSKSRVLLDQALKQLGGRLS